MTTGRGFRIHNCILFSPLTSQECLNIVVSPLHGVCSSKSKERGEGRADVSGSKHVSDRLCDEDTGQALDGQEAWVKQHESSKWVREGKVNFSEKSIWWLVTDSLLRLVTDSLLAFST